MATLGWNECLNYLLQQDQESLMCYACSPQNKVTFKKNSLKTVLIFPFEFITKSDTLRSINFCLMILQAYILDEVTRILPD